MQDLDSRPRLLALSAKLCYEKLLAAGIQRLASGLSSVLASGYDVTVSARRSPPVSGRRSWVLVAASLFYADKRQFQQRRCSKLGFDAIWKMPLLLTAS